MSERIQTAERPVPIRHVLCGSLDDVNSLSFQSPTKKQLQSSQVLGAHSVHEWLAVIAESMSHFVLRKRLIETSAAVESSALDPSEENEAEQQQQQQ